MSETERERAPADGGKKKEKKSSEGGAERRMEQVLACDSDLHAGRLTKRAEELST